MKKSFYVLPAVLLIAVLAVLAACGDDDGGDSATPTPTEAAATPTGEPTPTPTPLPPNVTPRPITGRECEPGPQTGLGLISYLEFDHEDSSYAQGEPVEMTLTLRNCHSDPVELFYETQAEYDFSIEDLDGVEHWRWTDTQELGEAPSERSIAPEEIVEHTVTWDQTDRDGDPLEPGVYKVLAFSLGCGSETASDCHFGPVELVEIAE